MSSDPRFAVTSSIMRRTAAASPTSAATAMPRTPSASISAAVARARLGLVVVVDRNVGAGARQFEGDLPADPAAAAGDDRDPAGQR